MGIEDSDGSFRKSIHERPGIQNALEISKYLATNVVPEEEYWRLHRVMKMDFMDSFAILRGRIERGRDQKN
jgi:hypothetical protein